MDIIISFIACSVEIFSLILISDAVLKKRVPKGWFVSIIILYVIVLPIVLMYLQDATSVFKTVLVITLWTVLLALEYEGSFFSKLFVALIAYIFSYCIDYATMTATMLAVNVSREIIYQSIPLFIFGLFVGKTILFTVSFLLHRLLQSRKNVTAISGFEWVLILVIPSVTIFNLSLVVDSEIKRNTATVWLIVDAALLLAANIAVVLLLDKIAQGQKTRAEDQILQQERKINLETAKTLSTAYTAQRSLTHDFKNHLAVLNTLMQGKHFEDAASYLERLTQTTSQEALIVNTNNPVVDAVLHQKYLAARNEDTAILFNITDLSKLKIRNDDLVTVLSNLLDNAIEACQKVTAAPAITVKFLRGKDDILLSIRNTSVPVEIAEDSLFTSKDEAYSHGYGLKNVKKVLAQYGFLYTLSYEDGWFQFTTALL